MKIKKIYWKSNPKLKSTYKLIEKWQEIERNSNKNGCDWFGCHEYLWHLIIMILIWFGDEFWQRHELKSAAMFVHKPNRFSWMIFGMKRLNFVLNRMLFMNDTAGLNVNDVHIHTREWNISCIKVTASTYISIPSVVILVSVCLWCNYSRKHSLRYDFLKWFAHQSVSMCVCVFSHHPIWLVRCFDHRIFFGIAFMELSSQI